MRLFLKEKAIVLRRNGYFYGEIAKDLGLAKSTAYVWTKDIPLTNDELDRLNARISKSKLSQLKNQANTNRQKKILKDLELKQQAKIIVSDIDNPINRDKVIASIMFWCEGSKGGASGVRFTNSDPSLVLKFLNILRHCFDIEESRLRAVVRLHDYHNISEQLLFWSKITEIPLGQFTKPYIKPHTGIRKKVDYPGCINIRYNDSSLGRLLTFIYTEYSKVA